MRFPVVFSVCGLVALLNTSRVFADENYFGYSYGAETLPKGRPA